MLLLLLSLSPNPKLLTLLSLSLHTSLKLLSQTKALLRRITLLVRGAQVQVLLRILLRLLPGALPVLVTGDGADGVL